MKRTWKAKEVIRGWRDKPLRIQKTEDPFDEESTGVEVGNMTVFDAMIVITNTTQVAGKLLCTTLEDSSRKKSIKKALLASMKSGVIELEAEDFKWLKNISEIVSPVAWQENANEVHDIITEGFKKENEPPKSAGEKKSKEKKDAPPAEKVGQSETEETSEE